MNSVHAATPAAGGVRQTFFPSSASSAPQLFPSALQTTHWSSMITFAAASQVSGNAEKEEQLTKMNSGQGIMSVLEGSDGLPDLDDDGDTSPSALDESDNPKAVADSNVGSSPQTLNERANFLGKILDDSQQYDQRAKILGVDVDSLQVIASRSRMHEQLEKLITNPSYTGDSILGAILMEDTMGRRFGGIPTAQYLWNNKKVVPFLSTDIGLAQASDGVQMMKDNPGLEAMLDRGIANGIWGTKQRSKIQAANPAGIKALVEQQFELGKRIIAKGLVPILQPEVDVDAPDKAQIEELLLPELMAGLAKLSADNKVIFRLTLPEKPNLYLPLMEYPQVVRFIAVLGGDLDESLKKLAENSGMIGSFDRAQLTKR